MATKVELELPDWADERHIRIFAGIEMVAEKYSWEKKWRVKDQRCVRCGECCKNLPENDPLKIVVDGTCVFLEQTSDGKYKCKIALIRPRTCCQDPIGLIKKGVCSITYKEQDAK